MAGKDANTLVSRVEHRHLLHSLCFVVITCSDDWLFSDRTDLIVFSLSLRQLTASGIARIGDSWHYCVLLPFPVKICRGMWSMSVLCAVEMWGSD